jgi:hypothetical protein
VAQAFPVFDAVAAFIFSIRAMPFLPRNPLTISPVSDVLSSIFSDPYGFTNGTGKIRCFLPTPLVNRLQCLKQEILHHVSYCRI